MRTFLCLAVTCLSMAPLSAQENTAAADKPILVLDTGGHLGFARAVFFTPDGKQLITAGTDKTVRIWDVAEGVLLKTLRLPLNAEDRVGLGGGIHAAALAPDGRLLAVSCDGLKAQQHVVLLLDLAEAEVARTLNVGAHVNSLAFTPDGKTVAVGTAIGAIRLFDTASGQQLARRVFKVQGQGHNFSCLAFAPDGQTLASGSADHRVRLWNMATGKEEKVLSGHEGTIHAIAWAPDGQTLATRAFDRWLCRWELDGTLLAKLSQEGFGNGVAFFPDGKSLLAQTDVWDLEVGTVRQKATGDAGGVSAAALSPNGKLAAWCGGRHMLLWNTATGNTVQTLGPVQYKPVGIGWSQDGHTVGWRFKGETDASEGDPNKAFDFAALAPVSAAGQRFLKAEMRLGDLTLEHRKVAPHWVIKRGSEIIPIPHALVGCATIADEQRLVIGTESGPLLYDTTGKKVRTYKGAGEIHTIAVAPDHRHFVTAGKDQVVRIWSLDREEALLALYVAGRDWIAWTPEGYYAASPGGERLMGWQVNNGADKLATFYPAAQFHKSLYRPDVVSRVLETESVEKALAAAAQAGGKSTELVKVEQVLPPKVAIVAPNQTGQTVTEPKLTVKAVAEAVGKHPVKELRLLLDDRPYEGERGLRGVDGLAAGPITKEWTVRLPPGPHRLSVLARSEVSSATSAALDVTYAPAAPPDLRPALHVLAIGINNCPVAPPLDFAVNDAEELANTLAARAKPLFREIRPQVITNEKATRAGILAAMAALKEQMKAQDVAVIFYAGHGYRDKEGRFYLLSYDTDEKQLDKSTVTGEDLKKQLADLPGRVLLLLDACHSGAIGGKTKGGSLTDELARELADDDCGVVVMCAAMGKEESRESAATMHGYFTLGLIEGLQGKADYNKDGLIHLTELDLYVDNRVTELSKDLQHPVTAKPTTVRSFALTKP